jgi:hypothetical protein
MNPEQVQELMEFLTKVQEFAENGLVLTPAIANDNRLEITSPRELTRQERTDLRQTLPAKYVLTFKVGMSVALVRIINQTLAPTGVRANLKEGKDRHLQVTLEGQTENLDQGEFWNALCDILKRDGYFKSWTDGRATYIPEAIKAIASNPWDRPCISEEDVKDLCIVLNARTGKGHDVNEIINDSTLFATVTKGA